MVEKFRTWKNSGKEFFDSIIITEKAEKSRGEYVYIVKMRKEKAAEERKNHRGNRWFGRQPDRDYRFGFAGGFLSFFRLP
jgi:hypothetical protein